MARALRLESSAYFSSLRVRAEQLQTTSDTTDYFFTNPDLPGFIISVHVRAVQHLQCFIMSHVTVVDPHPFNYLQYTPLNIKLHLPAVVFIQIMVQCNGIAGVVAGSGICSTTTTPNGRIASC